MTDFFIKGKGRSGAEVPPSHATLTQALAHSHAVLLRVEIVAVAGTAPVDEAHALLLVHVEVPAGHGGAAGARLRLQGAHLCEGDSMHQRQATCANT